MQQMLILHFKIDFYFQNIKFFHDGKKCYFFMMPYSFC